MFQDFDDAPEVSGADLVADLAVLVRGRLAPLALRLIRARGLDVPAGVLDALRDRAFELAVYTGLAHDLVGPALDVLAGRGIGYVISKGPGIAAAYAHAGDRPYADIDLIVAPARFAEAVAALRAERAYEEELRNQLPWAWMDRYCREAVNLVGATGSRIDVHHHVPPWLWGRSLTFERLAARATTLRLRDRDVAVLGTEHNLLVAALHVVSDQNAPGQNLLAWRDVLELARRCEPDAVRAAASAAGLGSWLGWILASLPPGLAPAALSDALAAAAGDPLPDARRLALIARPRWAPGHLSRHGLRLPAVNAALYLGGMAVPSRRWLDAKFPDRAPMSLRAWWASGLARPDPDRTGAGAS